MLPETVTLSLSTKPIPIAPVPTAVIVLSFIVTFSAFAELIPNAIIWEVTFIILYLASKLVLPDAPIPYASLPLLVPVETAVILLDVICTSLQPAT